MSDIKNMLARAVFEAVPVFKEEYFQTGYIHTEEGYNSIRAEDNRIVGHVSISTLIFGRKPGTWAPFGYEKDKTTPTELMQWCMDIFGETAKEARGSSFLVARKLKEKGNRVWQGTAKPIPVESTIEKASQVLFDQVAADARKIFNLK